MKTIKKIILRLLNKWRGKRELTKRIDELRKRDPFIYK